MKTLKESILKNIGVGVEVTIGKWCNEMGIENYKIVDGKINVNGDVDLIYIGISEIPHQFGEVTGYFNCSYCKNLKSLKGAPEKVGRNFDCSYCKNLKSLEGAPQEVGGDFYCFGCHSLVNLVGGPQKIGGDYYCYNCKKLKSHEGAPKEVGGNFDY